MKEPGWPFGPGHRPLRGWLMAQDPTLDAEALDDRIFAVTSRDDGTRFVVAFGPGRAVCSCPDDRRVRRPQATKAAAKYDAVCAHVWMVRFRLGEFPGAEPPLELRTHGVRGHSSNGKAASRG